MPAALLVVCRSLALICGGHRAVALENLAFRQQLAVFKRTVQRPPRSIREIDCFGCVCILKRPFVLPPMKLQPIVDRSATMMSVLHPLLSDPPQLAPP